MKVIESVFFEKKLFNLNLIIYIKLIIIILLLNFFILNKIFHQLNIIKNKNLIHNYSSKSNINFIYENYENNIITDKMKRNSGWKMSELETKFIMD